MGREKRKDVLVVVLLVKKGVRGVIYKVLSVLRLEYFEEFV